MRASGRKCRNMIQGVRKENGEWVNEHEEITGVAMEYFIGLFTTMLPHNIELALEGLENRVTDEMNRILLRPFEPEDVRVTIFQMHSSKAPGPNDMNANFY